MGPLQIPGEGWFAVAVVAAGFLTAIAFFAAILYTEHRKEMKLIESGQYPAAGQESRTWILAAGLLLLALGLADLLRSVWLGTVPDDGLTLSLLGIAALVYFAFQRRESRRALNDARAEAEAETTGDDTGPGDGDASP